jgi:Ca-activated chloride channel family protein
MTRFEDPWLFSFLALIPLMLYYHWKGLGKNSIRFSSLDNLKQLRQPRMIFLRHLPLALRCLSIMLLVTALARPQAGTTSTEVLTEGIDIMLCLDTSGSMQALDFIWQDEHQNRLQVVKRVVHDFIKGRNNDRIGMVVFGAEAFTQCPLTLDYGVLLSFLDRVEIGMAGDATAIGSALSVCVKRLKDLQSKSKVVIMLTDGRNNTGSIDPETAAGMARTFGIKVYTVGVGTEGKVPFLVDTIIGKQAVYQRVDLDEAILKKIAGITGGTYFKATNTEALAEIYRQIDQMEKTTIETKEYTEYRELFHPFLLCGLAFLLLEVVLTNTRLRKIP